MSYPKNVTEFKAVASAYLPNVPGSVDAYEVATANASGRNMAVQVFEALKSVEGLDDEGRQILCGAAQLCITYGWVKPPTEALEVFAAVFPTLPAEPAPEDVPAE
jgi:hypothetical protein